ncbi:hypothetical protein VOLCADRAFT_103610 [Volvox carteri f. nagariensis]|uniref:U-box domain-containing protein n=1 Tax=Volvox carteri f. nagariensis TaxID=3068 RepID=D8TNC0_VOLCA|nr:uncharacterized protein VOLCADRAFT_103610 [Volvox carteri f. nagariensis]EFJ50963.1 hypothetical protein VOLCADRAFT_103610 [Volvox carteri f. nagariensis]|eukprot:XP_002947975.1 hypothetical protein VOLCADRAFT_103610 [Volvox carteri f. nagariensis]
MALMREPVMLSGEPEYYERTRLESYMRRKGWKSPISGKAISSTDIIPCSELAAAIDREFWQRYQTSRSASRVEVDLTAATTATAATATAALPSNGGGEGALHAGPHSQTISRPHQRRAEPQEPRSDTCSTCHLGHHNKKPRLGRSPIQRPKGVSEALFAEEARPAAVTGGDAEAGGGNGLGTTRLAGEAGPMLTAAIPGLVSAAVMAAAAPAAAAGATVPPAPAPPSAVSGDCPEHEDLVLRSDMEMEVDVEDNAGHIAAAWAPGTRPVAQPQQQQQPLQTQVAVPGAVVEPQEHIAAGLSASLQQQPAADQDAQPQLPQPSQLLQPLSQEQPLQPPPQEQLPQVSPSPQQPQSQQLPRADLQHCSQPPGFAAPSSPGPPGEPQVQLEAASAGGPPGSAARGVVQAGRGPAAATAVQLFQHTDPDQQAGVAAATSGQCDLDRPAGHEAHTAKGLPLQCAEVNRTLAATASRPPQHLQRLGTKVLEILAAACTSVLSCSNTTAGAAAGGSGGGATAPVPPGALTSACGTEAALRSLPVPQPPALATAAAVDPTFSGRGSDSCRYVTSFNTLHYQLNQLVPSGGGGDGCCTAAAALADAAAVASNVKGTVVFDLQGASLHSSRRGPSRLIVRGHAGAEGGVGVGVVAVVIRNGSIDCPGGVLVEGGAEVTFQNVTFATAAKSVQSHLRAGCVLALEGGCAELSGRCEISGGPYFGLAAVGPGSCVRAELVTVQGTSSTAGFLAMYGGELQVVKCSALRYGDGKGAASTTSGAGGTVLLTAGGAEVMGAGFAAVDGGRLISSQCVAQQCAYSGFLAAGPGARLTSLGGCRAEENGWAGFACMDRASLNAGVACVACSNAVAGFVSYTSAVLTVSDRCVARGNGGPGWCASRGSWIVMGRHCKAIGNVDGGFAAQEASALFAGEGCEAEQNRGPGWVALDGSQLVAAVGCRAAGNRSRGFMAQRAARLVVGKGCEAAGNGAEGFAALDGAVVVVGAGGRAARSTKDGFAAAKGSRLEAAGCASEGNRRHGFSCDGSGSLLLVGPGCRANGNQGWGALVWRDMFPLGQAKLKVVERKNIFEINRREGW